MMSLELLNTLASIGTFTVIAASAIAAAIQLRHLNRNNQLQAVLALRAERNLTEIDQAYEFVVTQLQDKLKDQAYRDELEREEAPSRERHKELLLADFYEHIGAYVKKKLIDEDVYFEQASPGRYWALVEPAIAIYRRRRGKHCFDDFEYLVVRELDWDKAHPQGTYPAGVRRLDLKDPFLQSDASRSDRTAS